jgi:hypothetical protein
MKEYLIRAEKKIGINTKKEGRKCGKYIIYY